MTPVAVELVWTPDDLQLTHSVHCQRVSQVENCRSRCLKLLQAGPDDLQRGECDIPVLVG